MDSQNVQNNGEEVKPARQVWAEPPLGTIDQFQQLYSQYDHCIVTIYQIVRDLHIKQEVVDIEVIDGHSWNLEQYFLRGKALSTNKQRLMVPFHLDAEIDLPWLHNLAQNCDENDEELYLCIHTPESIM
jgi:hypothetical protein